MKTYAPSVTNRLALARSMPLMPPVARLFLRASVTLWLQSVDFVVLMTSTASYDYMVVCFENFYFLRIAKSGLTQLSQAIASPKDEG
jgi:hypothetical protein